MVIVIVNIDVIKDEFHGDTSKMFIVGKPTILGERRSTASRRGNLYHRHQMVKPGIRLRTVAPPSEISMPKAKVSPWLREYCGHGIGRGFMKNLRCCIMMQAMAARRVFAGFGTPVTP